MSSEGGTAARVVLLGASNLTLGLGTVLANARRILGVGRLEVFAALGHGRSYGSSSRVLFRGLPAIRSCGLWSSLNRAEAMPTYALLTDVGNDIGYGARPATLLAWAEQSVERLQALGAQIVLTSLPRGRLKNLRDWEIRLTRRIMFPSSTLSPEEARERISAVDSGLEDLARRSGVAWVETRPEWYGIDPMHVRRAYRPACWHHVLSLWRKEAAGRGAVPGPCKGGWWEGCRLLAQAPERRWLFGVEQYREQDGRQIGPLNVRFF